MQNIQHLIQTIQYIIQNIQYIMQTKEYITQLSPLYMKYKLINPNTKQTKNRAGHTIFNKKCKVK